MNKQHEQALLFLRKARSDEALLDEVWDSEQVPDDVVGFHCQQAAEKLLKALLSDCGAEFPRTHSLRTLMDLLEDAGRPLPADCADVDTLTPFGTMFRYEDIPSPTTLDRGAARRMLQLLRTHAEASIAGGAELD